MAAGVSTLAPEIYWFIPRTSFSLSIFLPTSFSLSNTHSSLLTVWQAAIWLESPADPSKKGRLRVEVLLLKMQMLATTQLRTVADSPMV